MENVPGAMRAEAQPYPLRAPCRCGETQGHIETRNGQDVVTCASGHFAYNAPRTETGRAIRTLRSRPDISPGQSARIFLRDGNACVLCHRDDVPLHVGHLLSVEEGRALGATDTELWDNENLAVMCGEHNTGMGKRSVSLRLALMLLRATIARDRKDAA